MKEGTWQNPGLGVTHRESFWHRIRIWQEIWNPIQRDYGKIHPEERKEKKRKEKKRKERKEKKRKERKGKMKQPAVKGRERRKTKNKPWSEKRQIQEFVSHLYRRSVLEKLLWKMTTKKRRRRRRRTKVLQTRGQRQR
jgi:hypothetical protein